MRSVRRNAWSITCDAFGTMQTPAYPGGTQVLRLLWDRGPTVDSTFIDLSGTGNGPWMFSSVSSAPGNLTYMFAQNGPMPLVIDVAAGGLSASYYSAGQPDAIGETSTRTRRISAYPVPVQDDLVHIPLGEAGEIHTVEVLDALGLQVKRAGVNGADMLHLSTGSLAAGTYVFKCLNDNGAVLGQGRFVVAR